MTEHQLALTLRPDKAALTRLLVRLHGLGVEVIELHAAHGDVRCRVRGEVSADRLVAVARRLVEVQAADVVTAPALATRVVVRTQPSLRTCTPHPWATSRAEAVVAV